MSDQLNDIQFALDEFDRSRLPESQRDLTGDDFRHAVQDHLAAEFIDGMGAAEVVVTEKLVIIRWTDSSSAKSITERGVGLLQEGDIEKGIATLRVAIQRDPADALALLNLAMALSDKGELDEAIPLLTRVVKDHPSHPHGWVALGVAYARQNNLPSAINALKKAVEINPQDGHSHKNLGAILAQSGSIADSIPHLRRATALLPNDPSTWLNLGLTLEDQGELDAADEAFVKVLSLDPTGQLGERAQRGRSQIAEKSFRERGGNLRPDAVSYCLNAIKRFEGMPKPDIQKISFEIAMLGTRGLDVNSPEQKYTLNSIPGTFSGLQLLCIEYVGFQVINPSLDLGFDLSREYQAALAIYGHGKG
jgi:tetratricopeptide (TPR) repeat protein